jgi:thiol-disulfide isomerase/thioredoxin
MAALACLLAGLLPRSHGGSRLEPEPMADFRLPIEGRPGEYQTLGELRGRVVLLNFWATWCVPCRREFPALEILAEELGPRGLSIVAVNIEDTEANAAVARFLAEAAPTFPVLRDLDLQLAQSLQVPGMPATFLVDRQGRLRWEHSGYQAGDEEQYRQQAELLLAELP